MKNIKFILIIILLIFITKTGYPAKIQKHFLNAKLAYINSDFDIAVKECSKSISLKEVSYQEIETFFKLIKFVKRFAAQKYKEAESYYKQKKYNSALVSLSDILKRDSKNKKAKSLYKIIIKKLTKNGKEKILKNIEQQIKKNIRFKNDVALIALYSEKLLITPDDNKTKLELEKVRLKYKSAQTIMEINKMIAKLKKLIKRKNFDLDKAKLIVNNILYIDSSNKKAREIKKILDNYNKNDKNIVSKIEESISKKYNAFEEDNRISITKDIVKNVITKTGTDKINTNSIVKQQNKNRAKIHFFRGINRYNNELYKEAKYEFKLAKYYNPAMVEANIYISKCENKEKKKLQKNNTQIKKDIKVSKNLVKKKKIEKAINLLYNSITTNNINNSEGQKYLSKIIKKNILQNKTFVNPYSSLFRVIKNFKNMGLKLYKNKKYGKSIVYWETILEFFPKDKIVLNYWKRTVPKLKNPKGYIKYLYKKGVSYYNMGYYEKSLFYLNLISRIKSYFNIYKFLKTIKQLSLNSRKYLKQNQKTEEQLSRIYNAALLDFIDGNYTAAISKWEYILKIDPGNIKARFNIDKVNNILSGNEKMNFLSQLPEKIKIKVNKYYYRGIVDYQKHNYADAIKWFKKVLEIIPKHQKAINNINKLKILLRIKQNEG